MIRTQIYLSEKEKQALAALSRRTGRSRSELIRSAIDALIEDNEQRDRLSRLRAARGMWQGRTDGPDIRKMRAEMDRPPHR